MEKKRVKFYLTDSVILIQDDALGDVVSLLTDDELVRYQRALQEFNACLALVEENIPA